MQNRSVAFVLFGSAISAYCLIAQTPPSKPVPLAPESAVPAEAEVRSLRSLSFNFPFDSPLDSDDPTFGGRTITGSMPNLDELPGDRSDAIVLGTISAIQPYLSQDHASIYSEYTVHVEKVIDKQGPAFDATGPLSIDQIGGSIILPGGRVVREEAEGFGLPVSVGGRYLFFLTHVVDGDYYQIVKLWELKNDHVRAMAPDDLGRSANHLSHYDGMTVDKFLLLTSGLKATRSVN